MGQGKGNTLRSQEKDEHEKFCSRRVAAEKSDGWRKVGLEFAASVSRLARKVVSKDSCFPVYEL